jgi:hypothetical protein
MDGGGFQRRRAAGYRRCRAGGIRIFLGSAAGAFSSSSVAASAFDTAQLAIGDLNRDGKADLAFSTVTNREGRAQVGFLLNDGAGVFSQATALDLPSNRGISSITAADLTGDRRAEILAGGSFLDGGNFYSLAVFRAGEDGTFARQPFQREIDFGPSSLVVTDVDADGKADLLASHCCGELTTRVYAGKGDGTFSSLATVATAQDTTRLWLADFNGDGVPELAARNQAGVSLATLRYPDTALSR